MSQDLWHEFGGDSRVNPWTQHVSDELSKSTVAPIGDWGSSEEDLSSTGWGPVESAQPARQISELVSTSGWTVMDAWNQEKIVDKAFDHNELFQHHLTIAGAAQDDDFGEFEVPEPHSQVKETDTFFNDMLASKPQPKPRGSQGAEGESPSVSTQCSALRGSLSKATNPEDRIARVGVHEQPNQMETLEDSNQIADIASKEVEQWDDLFNAKVDVNQQGEAEASSVTMEATSMFVRNKKSLDITSDRDELRRGAHLKMTRASGKLPVVPSNVPPPSVLISYLTGVLQVLPGQVRQIGKSLATHTIIAEDGQKALENQIGTMRVAAHIIAGRKLRWKRDVLLSQNMKIGPAQAGNKGGMKLVGIDKAESQREDREVAEFLILWGQNSSKIRTALTTLSGRLPGCLPTLPDVTDKLPIMGAQVAGASIPATKCCVLCGLKRNERVNKVDAEVWDNFEEWWTDLWGHTECRLFWEEHEKSLRQR